MIDTKDQNQDPATVQFITDQMNSTVAVSVVTLVSDQDKYQRVLDSFYAYGFNAQNCEFIALDNRDRNRFDGYAALRQAVPKCSGQYILFCHDDVELIEDGFDDLMQLLHHMNQNYPDWLIAGNAGKGWSGFTTQGYRHIDDPHGRSRINEISKPVYKLDENFFVMRRDRMVYPSLDAQGFHLYARDLVHQATFLGGNAYVIPFMLRHHSAGNAKTAEYREAWSSFLHKYATFMVLTYLRHIRRVIGKTLFPKRQQNTTHQKSNHFSVPSNIHKPLRHQEH